MVYLIGIWFVGFLCFFHLLISEYFQALEIWNDPDRRYRKMKKPTIIELCFCLVLAMGFSPSGIIIWLIEEKYKEVPYNTLAKLIIYILPLLSLGLLWL